MFDTPAVRFALDTVREAALLTRRVQSQMVTDALTKGDKSPVTVGDFAAQALVAQRLQAAAAEGDFCPVLVGEESAAGLREPSGEQTLQQVVHFVRSCWTTATPESVCAAIDRGTAEPAEAYWTLDPIDGTKGFLRGDQYAVALALVVNGRVEIGVLGCPELVAAQRPERGGPGSLLVAVRDRGVFVQPLNEATAAWQRLTVSSLADPAAMRVLRSVEKGHTNLGAIDHLATALGITAAPVGMDSQAKYAVLAAGGGEMLVRLLSTDRPDYREKVWDQAAGAIVVEEAGGRITDLDGKPLDFSQGRTLAANRGVLATNGVLHEAALRAVHAIGA
ncbi:3'(2'),5'-bisphosphate nucleotidase [Botrimarina hoheduenensis]|uniref:3'(2'),5'-bisphosphate nucleotidase n=1 Tax=Botrimarina hoheduenensis TaxID=2528000 RepID=A0A5C5W9V2_9BACT|nr:3'(2'),5'-bisphosphate nucleotidase [Botrimarina hoheduenensis]TWT47646.1 Histidinol-phosphatase [Botrimarina hoheduenensis]